MSVVDLIFAVDLAGRVLPFDSAAAREFRTSPRAGVAPRSPSPKPTRASLPSPGPAAPLWRHETLGDFSGCGLELIDPWV
jgi:hypothetical protein